MLLNTPLEQIFLYFLLGSPVGYYAYLRTARLEAYAIDTMAPLSFITYLGLFGIAKHCLDNIGNRAWIGVGVIAALWSAAIVLRESTNTVLQRILFFGAALLIASGIGLLFMPLFGIVCSLLLWGFQFNLDYALPIYCFSVVISVFAAPVFQHLFHVAKSMLPKPD